MFSVSPSEAEVFTALRTFLLGILPSGGAQFNGFIEGDVLTVASIIQGSAPISLGDPVLGVDIAYGTVIGAFVTGTGGVGTYRVSIARALGGASDSKAELLRRDENKRCVHRGGSRSLRDLPGRRLDVPSHNTDRGSS